MSGKVIAVFLLISVGVLLLLTVFLSWLVNQPIPTRAREDHTPILVSESVGLPELKEQELYFFDRLWFGGDVMLSRQVGEFARKRGVDFPWRGLDDVIGQRDGFVINFEACVSTSRQFDWGVPMRFPVDSRMLVGVASSGVTHASLANNHGLDCGGEDLRSTKERLAQIGVSGFGHPLTVDEHSVATTSVGGLVVGILAIHTLFEEPDLEVVEMELQKLRNISDIQVVYVHWGEEYELLAGESQRTLATWLSAQGVDVVIGHHPHVVQNIERIGETLVLYSLGNLIFDQYFSTEVQQGLLVGLEVWPAPLIRLQPVSSVAVRTQPHPLEAVSAQSFLEDLAERSDASLRDMIISGQIPITINLASSTKPGMIAP